MTDPNDDLRSRTTDPQTPVNDPERADEHPAEAGAYIGREPERAADTIPGGVRHDDERISAGATQSSGSGRPDQRGQPTSPPSGHRDGPPADDDSVRDAGQDR